MRKDLESGQVVILQLGYNADGPFLQYLYGIKSGDTIQWQFVRNL